MTSTKHLVENSLRAGWKTGASCQIYSNSKKKWFNGEVAQIFTDEEGEWLEIRYDKSMSKQVQRYSADIRPHPDDLKPKRKMKKKQSNDPPFDDDEMKVRAAWDKGDEVEIFSNTHQEWYLGEVVDIIKDDEGEWLNCVWARANGEAMSKQVQRFSTDVRPVQDDNSSTEGSSDEITSNSPNNALSQKDKIQNLAKKIAARKNNFRRRCPAFSRTLRPSTFTYPATSSSRRSRKLLDLEETQEKNQHVIDCMPSLKNKKQSIKRVDIESMKPMQVRDFIRSLGSAYEKYATRKAFRNISGRQLIKVSEKTLSDYGISAKLHRNKMLLEIARNDVNNSYKDIFCNDVEVLNWSTVKVQEWCSKTQVISVYANKFFSHGIDGLLLFELDAKDLSTIGVKKIHQQRVLDIIAKFAKASFLASNEEEKDPEMNGSGPLSVNIPDQKPKNKRTRESIAHIDVSQLENGSGGIVQNQNNDAIIYTMGQLLLELGEMFKVGKVQDLTSRLKQQLNELQQNSNHPQMIKRGSIDCDSNNNNNNMHSNSNNNKENEEAMQTKIKMQDHVATSPTGVDAAWINTQKGAKGHKRRSSLPFINTNVLDGDDEDEDELSDLDEVN